MTDTEFPATAAPSEWNLRGNGPNCSENLGILIYRNIDPNSNDIPPEQKQRKPNMTTPNDLYAMTPERSTHDLSYLAGTYFNHAPEINEDLESYLAGVSSVRVEIRFIKDWRFDYRRVWRLATVWFDGKPVMVIQNAGREGDDHNARFVTDVDAFVSMCEHIKALLSMSNRPAAVDPDNHLDGLTEFYGNCLGGHFETFEYR